MNELKQRYMESMNKLDDSIDELNNTCEKVNEGLFDKPIVRIVNPLQVFKYMKNGVEPIMMYPDLTTERIVFVFYKENTHDLYKKWLNREI